MNSTGIGPGGNADPVEMILRQARSRPVPPADQEQAIRDAVRGEWRTVVASRNASRRRWQLAAAAAIVMAVTAVITTLVPAPPAAVAVAAVQKSVGTAHTIDAESRLAPLDASAELRSGDVVETSSESALGLAWLDGGSLRIDEDTRIELIDRTTIFLRHGRIYFDSEAGAGQSRLTIETEFGTVTHLGTRYMAYADDDRLTVAVREGSVRIDGRYFDEVAGEGKQVELRGSAQPVVADLAAHSAAWQWTESVSPGIALDNRSAYDFLQWVGRELGYTVVFDDAEAEAIARAAELAGQVEADPRTELRYRMLTTDLVYRLDATAGEIHVALGPSRNR